MRGLRFLDFDLMFQRVEKGYLAKVLGSPAGQASLEFTLPFSEMEIENFLLRFGRSRQPVRRLAATQIEAAKAFGGRLFEAAFQGEIRSCLRSSLDEAQRLDLGLRLRLRLTDTPELNDLPWEFLLHPALGRFLALSTETPLVRYIDLPERVRPLAVKPPLEILAVISSPEDYPALDVEEEWRQLQVSLAELQSRGLLRLRRLESPTLQHLQRWLRRETCHILHFIGHGGFDPRTEDGLLLFSDGKGRGREVSGAELGTLLHDHRPLRLAVLNACEGARASRTDPFAGVAQSLVREGIPAVVAMQFEITDLAAIELAHELYSAVVDGYPIDAALGEARKALFFAGHELAWGTPVLYMRSPDGQLFDIDPAAMTASPGPVEVGGATVSAAAPPPSAIAMFEAVPIVEVPSATAPAEVVPPEGLAEVATTIEAALIEAETSEAAPVEAAPFETPPVAVALPEPLPVALEASLVEDTLPETAPVGTASTEPAAVGTPWVAFEAPPEALRAPEQEPSFEEPPIVQAVFVAPESVEAEEPPPSPASAWEPPSAEPPAVPVRRGVATTASSRKQRGKLNVSLWIGLGAFLIAGIVATGVSFRGDGRGGEEEGPSAQVPEEIPVLEAPPPTPVRGPGVYLAIGVKKGEAIQPSLLEIIHGESIPEGDFKSYDDLRGGCFESDLEQGHRLTWTDVVQC